MSGINNHSKFLRRCFELAARAKGNTSPNPLVGAVIVKNGKIISEGWHKRAGMPHAEAEAIEKAKTNLRGATLYCNLEPCRHTNKRTPPCIPRIIVSGITKVVVSNIDPNPEVAGKGIEDLKKAGIEVITGINKSEGEKLNKFFFKFIRTKTPYVCVKIAQTENGKISYKTDRQTWITCEESRRFVHTLRAEYDAVLVGADTVRIDDPQLTVRETEGRNPIRIILDGNLSSPPEAKVFNDGEARTILIVGEFCDKEKLKIFKRKKIEIIKIRTSNGKISIVELLLKLGELEFVSLLVEGGAEIFRQFIEGKHFDELITIVAPKKFGQGKIGITEQAQKELLLVEKFELGNDSVKIFHPKKEFYE